MAAPNQAAFLLQQYFHIALPRDVPGKSDRNLSGIESALLERFIDAVKVATSFVPLEHQPQVDLVRLALTASRALNVEGKIDKNVLVTELRQLRRDQALILYITEQNCALFAYKVSGSDACEDELIFEAFETSAISEKVLASEGALVWDFPGRAVSVPPQVYTNEAFQASIAAWLEQASIESVKHFAAITFKAAAPQPEIRDTTNPALLSGSTMSILEANGAARKPKILRKRVRDSVVFKDAKIPWRRSPFYLAIRVAIQRHLYNLLGPDVGRIYYKVIMAILISRFLEASLGLIPHEASYFLQQKLGRRLSKLEQARLTAHDSANAAHDYLLSGLQIAFEKVLKNTGRYLQERWEISRWNTRRIIRPLPRFASPSDFLLQLPSSGQILDQIAFGAQMWLHDSILSPLQLLELYDQSGAKAKPFAAIADRHLKIARIEETRIGPARTSNNCCQLAHTIEFYVISAGNIFEGYPELASRFILELMELWVDMDQSAMSDFPLLGRYHPGFDPGILDTLELLTLTDIKRVNRVQAYLSERCSRWSGSGTKTIFDSPAVDSFAVLYYDQHGDSQGLVGLRNRIERDAATARQAKEQEWQELSKDHEKLMQRVAESTCPYVTTVASDGTVVREHQRGCLKHKYKWQARQIKIKVFENPLPDTEPTAKAAVFELACPEAFAAYRDATWLLLATLAHPNTKRLEGVPLIRNYSGLVRYTKNSKMKITLGSSTKSHLDCHYAESGFPVSLYQVCRPCGLTLDYYDSGSQTWARRNGKPSFSVHCEMKLPERSPYRGLRFSNDEWPSSNAVIASQTKCPADLNVHEFTAWQGMLGGTHRRWLSMLRELGATNLNFSTESTWAVVSKLIREVGPSSVGHNLRDIHAVFDDQSFCKKLLQQVSHRLGAIRRNWREPVQMDTLISILLKVASLSVIGDVQAEASILLDQACGITWDWCATLQSSATNDSNEATTFAVWASVLCKRTFQRYEDTAFALSPASLRRFIGASVALQENLVGRFELLSYSLRNAVLSDLLFTYRIRHILRTAVLADPNALLSALDDIWPVPDDVLRELPSIGAVPDTWWIQVVMKIKQHATHYIHYNLVRGDLLIDGKQSGTLPAEYREHSIIQTLFGTHNLRVRPSYLPGMSLFVAHPMPYGNWVHLGFRHGHLVVRAIRSGVTLELIERNIFHNGGRYDLPLALIKNCYHWLDLDSAILEIRQDDIWKSKESSWKLNLRSRRASKRGSTLIDPCSAVAKQVAQSFQYFEYAPYITVFQPQQGPIVAELKRLELSFFVNNSGLLQCRQLGAEIVYSNLQDAGVWYGLRSKLVLRSIKNTDQRIILIPEGAIKVRRDGHHVMCFVENSGSYLRFEINEVLGRIECPAEPRLLYTKALWHAYTSYFLPDPLTGRTGVEEALYLLKSAMYKPWGPLPDSLFVILDKIASLTPRRGYYPTSMKCMETVHWNEDLTTIIQDDRYRAVVEKIWHRSSQLRLFQTSSPEDTPQMSSLGNPHLETRTHMRCAASPVARDQVYESRDRRIQNGQHINVFAIARLLAMWPAKHASTERLASLLQNFPVIGGYIGAFDRVQISDLISVNLGENWGSLVQSAIEAGSKDRYRLMFLFAPMALTSEVSVDLLHVLLAYAVLPGLKSIEHPKWPSYQRFQINEVPAAKDLAALMKNAHRPHAAPPTEKGVKPGQRALARIKHEEACHSKCLELAKAIRAQWPQVEVDLEKLPSIDPALLDVDGALEPTLCEYKRFAQNFEFSQYLEAVQLVLDENCTAEALNTPSVEYLDDFAHEPLDGSGEHPLRACGELPSIAELLGKSILVKNPSARNPSSKGSSVLKPNVAVLAERPNGIIPTTIAKRTQHPNDLLKVTDRPAHIGELERIVKTLRTSTSSVQNQYGSELEQSIDALVKHISQPPVALPPFNITLLETEIRKAREACNNMLQDIREALEEGDRRTTWLKHAGLWPRLTMVELLAELSSISGTTFGKGTQEVLVELGVQVTALQRLLRIRDASRNYKQQQLYDERINTGHTNWSPQKYVDWLLLEIDSNLMLRVEQVEVANATISPKSGQNSVVQLLMGKGKTSCILPMVAAVLADNCSLLRIIVPRALLLQSAQIMQIKLGGLLNREVMHIPFSRKTPTEHALMRTFGQLHVNLRKSRGVMLSLPEHILSFKLSGIQRLCDEKLEEAKIMIKIQEWLDIYCRDVLDECDVSLAIRTQLIYPSGSQTTVDGHPFRWQTVQALLRLLRSYLSDSYLERQFPRSIEVVGRIVGDYPLMYFLRRDVEEHLLTRIVDDICKGKLAFLPCAEISASSQADIQTFISSTVVPAQVAAKVSAMFRDKQHLMKIIYLLRGLFVHRIFLSTLKKRWNVQYGLHPTRDPIAVPYHAKGVPSPTSEWGHPDVAIILTCLSFYYQGLDLAQFKQAFEQLLKADEPSVEYEKWATQELPESLRDYNAINVEDSSQLRELHHHIRFNVYLLDFYMNYFVFPRHAKQFDTKLQASGWDLVLYNPTRKPTCRTTGFSGTNDSRHQLPMMIQQNDLQNLAHTNAEVLSYLLQERSRGYMRMIDDNGRRLSEEGLLHKLHNPTRNRHPDASGRIRVLIDAGAQILEHNNHSLAKAWLKVDYEASAAVYFDSDHRPWVLYRKGKKVPLVASPFAENLGDCVVYLDESHCRGTDLKLPYNARAALTLGPHVTKDALAQAAMRLRLLGQSQAVTFFSPPEVHQSILDLRKKSDGSLVDSSDVIAWLLEQSCNAIEQLEPLYFTQGNTYLQHVQASLDNPDYLERTHQRDRFLSIVRSKELHTLKQLYEPKSLRRAVEANTAPRQPSLKIFANQLMKRKKEFQDRGIAIHSSALEEVEQEREVEFEVESVRETQKPVHFNALKIPKVHKDIEEFAKFGRIVQDSEAYQPMLSALQKTASGIKHGAFFTRSKAPSLFVSTQFSRTVKVPEPNDNFLRPCHWILWSIRTSIGLIVSPEEADALIPLLRRVRGPQKASANTHLIVYSAPVTRRMLHFNKLDYYAIPPLPSKFKAPAWLKIELGIFAGRLYFDWDEYEELANYLGIKASVDEAEGHEVDSREPFVNKPLTFLHDWLAVLRKGQDFEHTPMGFVTTGKPLSRDHPFFLAATSPDVGTEPKLKHTRFGTHHDEDEDTDDDDGHEDDEMYHEEDINHQRPVEHMEDDFDEENNTFFDAEAYVEGGQEEEKDDQSETPE